MHRDHSTATADASPVSLAPEELAQPAVLRERRLFASLAGSQKLVSRAELTEALEASGLDVATDPRLRPVLARLRDHTEAGMDYNAFCQVIQPGISTVERAISGEMVIPEFGRFRASITGLFEQCRDEDGGAVANYIPQLSRVDPEHWAASVCTIDGQRIDLGDHDLDFCVQSTCKPINYCLALEEHGEAKVHEHVGREPSGRGFNELALNADGKPHNPMINAGAIMCCSLLRPGEDMSDRFDYVLAQWRRACGAKVGFNNSVYLSERQTADRNFALGYFMQENKAFPPGTDLHQTLEFYFMCCSIDVTTKKMAVLAATLANGGVNPLTGETVFSPQTVRNCMSLMYSCGMYDFSGEFAFTVGLPAKSGVAGAIMVVVPNVMGMVTWSPRLDSFGNSVRGLAMARGLVSRYNFHNYDNLTGLTEKDDPRIAFGEERADRVGPVLWAASKGDVSALKRLSARANCLHLADYDRRTAMHLAAAEGHLEVIEFLLERGVEVDPVDRWGGTPRDDAERHGHHEAAALLEAHGARTCAPRPIETTS